MRCNNDKIINSAQSLLDDVSRVSKFDDFYYAGLLNQNSSKYGLTYSKKFEDHFSKEVSKFVDDFKEEKLVF